MAGRTVCHISDPKLSTIHILKYNHDSVTRKNSWRDYKYWKGMYDSIGRREQI